MFTRDVRAIDVAQLALETFVGNVVLLRRRHLARILIVMLIDVVEKRWKRWAELETQTTAMTKVVDTLKLVASVGLVEVQRMVGVVDGCQRLFFRSAEIFIFEEGLHHCGTAPYQ
jgi:hypothetical protein